MDKKRWCNVCKFLTYGCSHPTAAPAAPPDRLVRAPQSLALLAFDPVYVAYGSTAIVKVTPQGPFLPLRLVVPPEIGSSFLLSDLRIGQISHFASAGGAVSMSVFPPDPPGSDKILIYNLQGLPVVPAGCDIFLMVTNRTGAMLTFTAVIYGDIVHAPHPLLARSSRSISPGWSGAV